MAFTSNLRGTPIAQPGSGLISDAWAIYFRDQADAVASSPATVEGAPVTLVGQTASIGTTAIPTPALVSGLYRISWYQRVTTPAGVTSSLTTTVSWTDGGVTCSFAGAAMAGNTTATVQSNSQLIHLDGATPVSYSTVYASNPAGVMVYALRLLLQLESADL